MVTFETDSISKQPKLSFLFSSILMTCIYFGLGTSIFKKKP